MGRYENKKIVLNNSDEYKELFDRRGVSSIKHHIMGGLSYPTNKEFETLAIKKEVWKIGDAFWKYASLHYENRADLWWVIAHFNNLPTDAHVFIGQTIYIPLPLDKILKYIK